MNLDKNNIIEQARDAAKKAVDIVNPMNSPVNKAAELTHDALMSVIDEVAEAEAPKVGSVEVKQGEGVKEIAKGGLQAAAGGLKIFAEAAAKSVKSAKMGAEAAKDLVKGDTQAAKAKLEQSKDTLVDAVKHGTLGQAESGVQAVERIFKGAKQLGKTSWA